MGTLFIWSCSDDEKIIDPGVKLSISSSINSPAKSVQAGSVVITDFKICIRDIIFKNNDDLEFDTSEVQFRGPFIVDLLDSLTTYSETVGLIDLPNGVYDKLRLKLHKAEKVLESDEMFDKSIIIKGWVNGVPFEMWHDTDVEFDFDFISGLNIDDNNFNYQVDFNISQFLNSYYSIDLTLALDEDHDGIIEINPENDDSNEGFAEKLKENIKYAAELIKKD
ncbi:MAG: hypothetical protein A2W99_00805 [Bacteroidetes bacterium GWF2_33_16]|nr:MAG: hypothetical protein A2X00_03510 [Bacteroidetes bacterium GWE2_32_14]OFY08805.1 MAG: hypothetical protein A2W99_00805 [Bacteroidetes bacterium GWF2_33_16]